MSLVVQKQMLSSTACAQVSVYHGVRWSMVYAMQLFLSEGRGHPDVLNTNRINGTTVASFDDGLLRV